MHRNTLYIALILFLLSIGACAAAVYFASVINDTSAERAQSASNADTRAVRQETALRTQALAKDTESERSQLASIAQQDPLSLVDTIESVGTAVGVTIQLSNAQPDSDPSDLLAQGVRPVEFIVDSEGSFPALMHASELLESLPMPSFVSQMQIIRLQNTPQETSARWHMTTYLHVLTTL